MPEIPNKYTVRDEANEAAYVALFNAIAAVGVFERSRGRHKKYLYPGDGWKYWAVTSSVWQSRIINRMRVEDDFDRPRAEGQLEAVAYAQRQLRLVLTVYQIPHIGKRASAEAQERPPAQHPESANGRTALLPRASARIASFQRRRARRARRRTSPAPAPIAVHTGGTVSSMVPQQNQNQAYVSVRRIASFRRQSQDWPRCTSKSPVLPALRLATRPEQQHNPGHAEKQADDVAHRNPECAGMAQRPSHPRSLSETSAATRAGARAADPPGAQCRRFASQDHRGGASIG